MSGQLSLFDAAKAEAAKLDALQRVQEHAEPDWAERALKAVEACAKANATFIVDDVWAFLDASDVPHEPRAMGAVMRAAQRAGLIAPTDVFRPSDRVTCHKNPRRVWESLILGVER